MMIFFLITLFFSIGTIIFNFKLQDTQKYAILGILFAILLFNIAFNAIYYEKGKNLIIEFGYSQYLQIITSRSEISS